MQEAKADAIDECGANRDQKEAFVIAMDEWNIAQVARESRGT